MDNDSKFSYTQSIGMITSMIENITYAYIHDNLTKDQIKDINALLRLLHKKVPTWSDTFKHKQNDESYLIEIAKTRRGK